MTKEEAGHAYLAAVAPVNDAFKTFTSKSDKWTNSTTSSQAAADAKPVVDVLTALEPKLLAIAARYPAIAADMKALITAYAGIQGDLAGLSIIDTFNASSWAQGLAKDAAETSAQVAVVRSELGLPPAPKV